MTNKRIGKAFKKTWEIMLGSNDYNYKTKDGWNVYACATLFIVIMMLNLLIAIIGETFS